MAQHYLLPLKMTSNTTPAPLVASCTTGTAFYAFDNNSSTRVYSTNSNNVYLNLGRPYRFTLFSVDTDPSSYSGTWRFYLDGVQVGSYSGTSDGSASITPTVGRNFRLYVTRNSTISIYTINLYARNGHDIPLPEILIGEPSAYFVSQQHGNDSNDGLTPETAWATVDKAMASAMANVDTDTYVYIGPGNYSVASGTLGFTYPGIDSTHRIIFKGDGCCQYLPNDSPGVVNISGNEFTLLDMYDRPYIEIHDLNVMCGPNNYYGVSGKEDIEGQVIKNCNIYSMHTGCMYLNAYNTNVMANDTCFESCNSYNCIAIGNANSSSNSGFNNGQADNCAAVLCRLGYQNNTTTDSTAWLCNTIATGGTASNCLASQCYVTVLPASWTGTMCGQAPSSAINTSSIVIQKLDLINIVKSGLIDWGYDLSAIPDAMTDVEGFTRQSNLIDIGPWELADYQVEIDDVYLNGPALKINGYGYVSFDLPVIAGAEITKSIYVKWFQPDTPDIDNSLKPQIIIKDLDGIQYCASCTAVGNTWEKLSVTITPNKTGILTVYILSRNTAAGSYVIFSDQQ